MNFSNMTINALLYIHIAKIQIILIKQIVILKDFSFVQNSYKNYVDLKSSLKESTIKTRQP